MYAYLNWARFLPKQTQLFYWILYFFNVGKRNTIVRNIILLTYYYYSDLKPSSHLPLAIDPLTLN